MVLRRRPLVPRTLDATSFTAPLEAMLELLPEVRTAAFIDNEGEAVDLATRDGEFEARVAGAVLSLPLHVARRWARSARAGIVRSLWITGGDRTAVTHRVGDGLDVVMVVDGTTVRDRALHALDETAGMLAAAAGVAGEASGFSVEAADTATGPRPVAIIEQGVRQEVSEVLGALEEGTVTHVLVRTGADHEMLLRYDRETGRWRRG